MAMTKIQRRQRIRYRIRKVVNGTPERPRMSVFRSNKQIYVQVIDDTKGITLVSAGSTDKSLAEAVKGKTATEVAALVGKLIAERAVEKGISTVSFDRGGYLYHGRVKSLADAAREGGLKLADINVKKVKTTDLELKDRLVAVQRVTKVTKGGRHFSFAAIVVVGDEKGVVGYGLGKANEVTTAISKGVEDAKKNLVKVPLNKRTIPHEQEAKFGGAKVFMKPAAPGTGVKAGGAMRAVFESVGVQDVLAKSKGSSNPHNLVKATIAALAELRDAIAALAELRDAYTVAGVRGIPMQRVFKG